MKNKKIFGEQIQVSPDWLDVMRKCNLYLKTITPDCEKPVEILLWFRNGMPKEAKTVSNGYERLLGIEGKL